MLTISTLKCWEKHPNPIVECSQHLKVVKVVSRLKCWSVSVLKCWNVVRFIVPSMSFRVRVRVRGLVCPWVPGPCAIWVPGPPPLGLGPAQDPRAWGLSFSIFQYFQQFNISTFQHSPYYTQASTFQHLYSWIFSTFTCWFNIQRWRFQI